MGWNCDVITVISKQLSFKKSRVPRVANFADIIKIAAIFIEATFEKSYKVKIIRNYLLKCICTVFLNIKKVADLRWKNADVSRTLGVCHVIRIFWVFFRQGITVSSFISVGSVWQILGRGAFLTTPSPICEQPEKAHPE